MRISTKGRYALRLMLDLAVNGKDNYISIKIFQQGKKYLINTWNKLSTSFVRPVL